MDPWKDCPGYIKKDRRYFIYPWNRKIVIKQGTGKTCTVIEKTPLPRNKVSSWKIKIMASKDNDGHGIYIGVAPSEISQNDGRNYETCGWYFNCFDSTLSSGPPHKYRSKTYGPRRGDEGHVHTKEKVGVIMDTATGELSFALDGWNYGEGYKEIPLNKPLFPCVLLLHEDDAVKLRPSRVREVPFSRCAWKRCPPLTDKRLRYSLREGNPRIAIKKSRGYGLCTIIGNTFLPPNKLTSWDVRVLRSKKDNGAGIFVGVAPSGIDQSGGDNHTKCGWYFNCFDSALYSGPPHNYDRKEYGPSRKENGQYVHTGGRICVTMNTRKGELSFAVNGVNLGVACEGIPLDRPLAPCVLMGNRGDSVEFGLPEAKDSCVIS